MVETPFTFLRGAAAVMAGDLATVPPTGLAVQLCGDAHIANYGVFSAPDRRLVVDVNDFDETLPGPFEWDVKRLVASLVVAGRNNGFDRARTTRIALEATQAYRSALAAVAAKDPLDVWYFAASSSTSWPSSQARPATSSCRPRSRRRRPRRVRRTEHVRGASSRRSSTGADGSCRTRR